MTRASGPPGTGATGRPWAPEPPATGVTCPACGLANEAGARVCRNCGLPIASASDPLRGVAPGRIDMPSTQRSGLSATIGLALVIGLLLVGGTLAVSGGGILSSGGRLGSAPGTSPSAAPATSELVDGTSVTTTGSETDIDQTETPSGSALGTSFDYTCTDDALRDLSRGKWFLSEVQAGVRSDESGRYDQIYWKLSRESKKRVKGSKATTVTMEWTTPKEAQDRYDISRVQGSRAIVVTFDGPVDITAGQTILEPELEAEGIEQVKKIQLFEDPDGKVRSAIGLRSESCARMEARGWGGKAQPRSARVVLDIEYFSGQ